MTDELRERICLPAWDLLSQAEMEAAAHQIERMVTGARFVRLEEHAQADQKRRVAVFEVNGVEMALVPGGRRMLGFDPTRLEASARAAWKGSFQEEGHPVQQVIGGPNVGGAAPAEMVQYLADALSARREVTIEAFLLERTSPAVANDDEDFDEEDEEPADDDPHVAKAMRVVAGGFRLPTADEWEHACSGGSDALFPWGDKWPVDTHVWDGGPFKDHALPNAFGLRYGTSPYNSEIVDDPEELHHGDGGSLICGESGPIAWITFSPWYRYRLRVTDDREIWFEEAHPRRARSIFPKADEGKVRAFEAPTVLDNAELAFHALRDAMRNYPGMQLDSEERRQLLEASPDLAAILDAHWEDADVLALSAMLLGKLDRLDEALAAASRAVELGHEWRALSVLGNVHRVRGEIDEAVGAFEEAAAVDPDDATALLDAGDALAQDERFAEAAKAFERALSRDATSGFARAMLPYARFRATGDRRYIEELRAYVSGPGKKDAVARELLREIEPAKTKVATPKTIKTKTTAKTKAKTKVKASTKRKTAAKPKR